MRPDRGQHVSRICGRRNVEPEHQAGRGLPLPQHRSSRAASGREERHRGGCHGEIAVIVIVVVIVLLFLLLFLLLLLMLLVLLYCFLLFLFSCCCCLVVVVTTYSFVVLIMMVYLAHEHVGFSSVLLPLDYYLT